ncbi:ATP-binding protein [Candidatus Viridilinea mediisalina]|uniref:histidine kinase n=1 Tax=Candidatus Viridilinea mediisalina TaxID=2024553 RepID=A0A2A6RGU6_9CHLR|nr:ATP-binding protein [Candidatus Viridilinea mediisalina]PDW02242.1 hypothetical protein CJ255_14985 [Candidatus Viridilinea mediisalina]
MNTITVSVERLLPFGLLVRLEDGREGLIRERELAWSGRELQRWRERFKPGDRLQAVLLGTPDEPRLELSLRLAEHDPWLDLVERYPLGSLVDGSVTGVQPYGAFIELEPGITGLLHQSRLPASAQMRPIQELFWIGDRVRVMVERLDTVHRQIGLSLLRARAQRWSHDWATLVPTMPLARPPLPAPADEPLPPQQPSWRLVVVEDDELHREALMRWCHQAGHQVRSAATAEAGLALVEADPPDLLLSDWGLPTMSGPELLMGVRRRWPEVRCALMSDWTHSSAAGNELEGLRRQGVALLLKPLRPEDMHDLLHTSFSAAPEPVAPHLATDHLAEPSLLDVLRTPLPLQEQVQRLLQRQLKRTHATKIILFRLDPVRRTIELVATAGGAPLNEAAIADLIYSPVRDVAEDGHHFRINAVQASDPRVRYLRPLLDFRACSGIPLPVQLLERYALFVFSARQRELNPHLEEYSAATALALATLLERDSFHSKALDTQRLALLGQLSRALVHEVNHRLSPVNFTVSELLQSIKRMASDGRSHTALTRDLNQLQLVADDLSLGFNRLSETAQMFGRVMVQARAQQQPLEQAVRETIELVRDMADRNKIVLGLRIDDALPNLVLPAIQVQQMLLNMLLNAIQQISLHDRQQPGHILVDLRICKRDGQPWVQIRIEDDGPGLHRELWERVFDLGFTTRSEQGSGLGLYITRSLAEALRARVFVEASFMLWGTTFVLELPEEACSGS